MITDAIAARLRALLAAATPGPWHVVTDEFDSVTTMAAESGRMLRRGGTTLSLLIAGRTPTEARDAAWARLRALADNGGTDG